MNVHEIREAVKDFLSDPNYRLLSEWVQDLYDIEKDNDLAELVSYIKEYPCFSYGLPGLIYNNEIEDIYKRTKENVKDTLQELESHGIDLSSNYREFALFGWTSSLVAPAIDYQIGEFAIYLENIEEIENLIEEME